MKTRLRLAVLVSTFCCTAAHAGTLTPLAQQPPDFVGLPLLLTDGSVMFQGSALSNWWKLTPDANGSYVNGTWSQLASIPYTWNYAPYAFASAVLADGRVIIEGGEYNENGPFSITNKGAIYDPVGDFWTPVAPPPGWSTIGDSASIVMPNGKFLLGDKITTRIAELDPATMTWTALAAAGKADFNAEEGWTLLPDGSILTVDVLNAPATERYTYVDASQGGHWDSAGATPKSLAFNFGDTAIPFNGGSYLPPGETGPCILRPDRTVFCTGASDDSLQNFAHTAIFSLDSGTWSAGPDFPPGDDAGDASATLLPNGNVLVAATSGTLYEFDGNQLHAGATAPPGALLIGLPSGETLVATEATVSTTPGSIVPYVALYRSSTGVGSAAWAPTIANVPSTLTPGNSYAVSGTQFNGLSQAQAFGDELVAPTNYPLVRITNTATHHVVYAHTHDHSTMGVATGSAVVSTTFDVPLTIEPGPSTLEVVANGIASAPASVDVASTATPFAIVPGLTGSWYDAQQSGHGFEVEVLPGNPRQIALFWFVFAPDGSETWIAGSGPVSGDHAQVQAYQIAGTGALFPPHF
ncbi:MAG TPA: hypothetical protein VFB32_06280, partial [Rudaea sp.]|nr:hypothetical protein [Rudaea sp.]